MAGTDAPTALALTSTDVPSTVDLDKNGGKVTLQWLLSRENAGGKVTLRHVRTGRTVEFPFEYRAGVRREWQGTLDEGALAPNGDYTWQLDAKPLNGIGPDLRRTGTFKVTRKAGLHDYDDNGDPDVLSRDAVGGLWRDEVRKPPVVHRLLVVGEQAPGRRVERLQQDHRRQRDLNGDGWSDLLATDASGVLWAYQGTGNWSAPFRGRTKDGGGWGGMNQITAVGDIAGTPQGDLLARDTAGVLALPGRHRFVVRHPGQGRLGLGRVHPPRRHGRCGPRRTQRPVRLRQERLLRLPRNGCRYGAVRPARVQLRLPGAADSPSPDRLTRSATGP
ncbi:FG-GAP repeat domain-containing protein [Streptomyces sp. NPDC057677]|uniref:FG-GAP repeat domain-containing protein n=1 Tax=unclassified Streptomyces TaxID=2593676 RepID=UPI0036B43968